MGSDKVKFFLSPRFEDSLEGQPSLETQRTQTQETAAPKTEATGQQREPHGGTPKVSLNNEKLL